MSEAVDALVFSDRRVVFCEVGCGENWSAGEVRNRAWEQVSARFGAEVVLRFAALDEPDLPPQA